VVIQQQRQQSTSSLSTYHFHPPPRPISVPCHSLSSSVLFFSRSFPHLYVHSSHFSLPCLSRHLPFSAPHPFSCHVPIASCLLQFLFPSSSLLRAFILSRPSPFPSPSHFRPRDGCGDIWHAAGFAGSGLALLTVSSSKLFLHVLQLWATDKPSNRPSSHRHFNTTYLSLANKPVSSS